MRFPGFIGGSGVTQSLISDAESTYNWYVEKSQSANAKSPSALFPTPGFSPLVTTTDVVGRGCCAAGSRIFMIIGSSLLELFINQVVPNQPYPYPSTGTLSFKVRGTVAFDGHPAQIVYSGAIGGQLGIASGGNFYSYVLATNVLAQQLNGLATMTAFANGFFFAFNLATGKVLLSKLNDGTSWDLGNFFQRELFPDPWQTIFTDSNNLLWLIGTESFEVWYDTGIGNQPFAPLSGLQGLYGIAASWAFTRSPLGNLWLAANAQGIGQLVLSTGSTPIPVSTYAFSVAGANYLRTSTIADAEMMAYQQLGHTFAVVSFPSVPASWAYDLTEQGWANRGAWNPNLGRFDLWAPRIHQTAFGRDLVVGWTGATICDMNPAYTTEIDGVTGIVRERTTPGLTAEHARIPIDQFELLMAVGITPGQVGQASDPTVTLRTSFDGGETYGNERRASMGKIGKYQTRVYWNQLGAPADVVMKVRSSDPAPSRIIDAWVNNLEK